MPLPLRVVVGFYLLAVAVAPAGAIDEFLRAIVQAPGLSAAARRVEAAQARLDAAGRLPNPEVEGMAGRMEGPMNDTGTMWSLAIRQPLPKRGERAADRAQVHARVAMAEADFAVMAGDVAADVAMALAEAEGANARIRLLDTQLARLDAVLRTVEIQLSAGTGGRLADRLTVQTRMASMQLMIEDTRRMAEDALAEARGRLGLPEHAPLPPYAAPSRDEIDPAGAAAVQLAAARADEADAMVRMARASANPMTAVGLTFQRERMSMGNEDTVGIAFMSELPWRSRRYARADVRAAQAERAAAQDDATAVRYRINATVARVERAERLAALARRLNDETLGRLNAEYDAMVRSASVNGIGGSAVLQTVEVLEKATEAELQVLEADTAAQVARADLWRHAAVDRFSNLNP